jgi:DNA modification methylase
VNAPVKPFRLLCGDALTMLRTLPDASVHCCVTSPPYWGLRNYKVDGQLGLEPTPTEYVEKLVAVMREVRRVLRDDGVLWLNLGDSYAGSGPSGATYQSRTTKARAGKARDGAFAISKTLGVRGLTYDEKKPVPPPGLKHKDLVGIPWLVAFALREDGWYLRQDIIWAKGVSGEACAKGWHGNPMPESVTDRCTKAHEYVFLLSKSASYYYDAYAIRDPNSLSSGKWGKAVITKTASAQLGGRHGASGFMGREMSNEEVTDRYYTQGRNRRSVWTVTTKPFKGAHFAVFPESLVEPMILASCPDRCCPKCGAGWERVVKCDNPSKYANVGEYDLSGGAIKTSNPQTSAGMHRNGGGVYSSARTLGFRPGCDCGVPGTVPGIVLDPFLGSGTSAAVARRLGRRAVGIELNSDYCEMARKRVLGSNTVLSQTRKRRVSRGEALEIARGIMERAEAARREC